MTCGGIAIDRVGARESVVVATLTRVERANAYTVHMLERLQRLLASARNDSSVSCLIITGAGNVFCAGADRWEIDARIDEDGLALLSREVFDAIAAAPWPVVAAINGPAVGGGLELALAADLRLCTPNASFRLPEVSLGLLPAAGGIRRLVEQVGSARAKELVLFDGNIDAFKAAQWGIVSEVVADPLAAAIDRAELLATRSRICLTAGKLLINERSGALTATASEAVAQALLYGRRKNGGIHDCQ